MTKLDLMARLVADLAYLNIKFHNLHWNVVGSRFVTVHEHLEDIYDEMFKMFDDVAERIRMLGEYAPASIKEYTELTRVTELENENYSIDETYSIVKQEFLALKKLILDIREAAEMDDDSVTVAMMDEYLAYLGKQLWFIHQSSY